VVPSHGCTVRVLEPQPGARVQSGQVVRVVVQVSVVADTARGFPKEGFPKEQKELSDGEALPAGRTLVLSQDGHPGQTMGRTVGHIGDLRSLPDGVHSLRAWLADSSGCRRSADDATHFFVGSPGDGCGVVSWDGTDVSADREHTPYREAKKRGGVLEQSCAGHVSDAVAGARAGQAGFASAPHESLQPHQPSLTFILPDSRGLTGVCHPPPPVCVCARVDVLDCVNTRKHIHKNTNARARAHTHTHTHRHPTIMEVRNRTSARILLLFQDAAALGRSDESTFYPASPLDLWYA
jgi:hypothetical protein